jgi:membrane fusion protein (multidrug efflux system)
MIPLAAALCALTACSGNQAGGSGGSAVQTYPVATVGVQDVTLETTYPVTLKGKEDIEIRPRIDGFIDEIYIDEGAVVTAGQTLFKINSPQAEQALETARAAVAAAQAQLNTATLNYNRMQPLAEKNIISPVQLETYQYAHSSALAAKAQADAALKHAEATIGWTRVASPVSGMTGAIPYRKGSLVSSQNVLTTVANVSRVYAYFSLNEKALEGFLADLDEEVTLTLADGTVYPEKGKIETVTGVLNITTGSAGVRVAFPNERGVLKSGTSGKITIPRTLKNTLLIPQKATFAQQDKVLVYQVQGDSVVQRVISVIATPDSKHYVVTHGLSEGDRIVTDGVATLTNGKKIAVE